MTSDESVVHEPQREQWVDTLRVVLISGVIVVHTATAYVTDFAGYYYDDERVTSSVVSIVFALPALMGGIFGLGPLFVVAGWFSVRSLTRRGPAGFAGGRLLRLGVPLVFFVLLVNPLADYLGNLWDEDDTFLGYLAVTEFSIMWFVVALLACSLGYAALRSVRPRTTSRPRPDGRSLVVAAAVICLGSLAVWQFTTLLDTHLMNVRVSAWTQAAVLFALGVMTAEAGWDGRLPRPTERLLGRISVAGIGLTLVLVSYAGARDQVDMALGGINWARRLVRPPLWRRLDHVHAVVRDLAAPPLAHPRSAHEQGRAGLVRDVSPAPGGARLGDARPAERAGARRDQVRGRLGRRGARVLRGRVRRHPAAGCGARGVATQTPALVTHASPATPEQPTWRQDLRPYRHARGSTHREVGVVHPPAPGHLVRRPP